MKIESDEIKQTAINTQLDIILQYFRRLSRWQTKLLLALFLTFISGVTVFLSDSLSTQGRLTIIVFLLTVILWSMTSINAGYIALMIVLLMLGLWLTEKWHGLEIATVTVIGAILLTAPKFGVMKWKDAVKDVSWNLIIFVGATLALGHALISSGASEWIINNVFRFSDINTSKSHFLILLLLAIISLTSHIYMTSHTARAAALVPPLLYLASSLDINPVTVLFISTLGMDYCLTFITPALRYRHAVFGIR